MGKLLSDSMLLMLPYLGIFKQQTTSQKRVKMQNDVQWGLKVPRQFTGLKSSGPIFWNPNISTEA